MLETVFSCIKKRVLDNIPEIKDVRVYNGQDVFSDESTPWMNPSVFVDFTNVEYDTTSYRYQRAELEVRVMLFHESANLNHLEVFALNTKLNSFLNGWTDWGGLMDRVASETDTNYDRMYVMNTDYVTTFEESTVPDDGSQIPIGDWSETGKPITGVTDWSWAVTGLTANDNIAFEFEIPYSGETN